VRDTHFKLAGPVVAQLSAAFAADWFFAAGETLEGDAWFPRLDDAGSAVARVIRSGPDEDIEKIEFMILEAVTCARHAIKIATPYFLPSDRLVTALALAALRGVTVEVIVPGHGNHRLVEWAMRAQIGPLIEAGCRIWRSPPPFNHSKLMSIDGIWGLIGSANWDMRSLRLNFELDIEVYHTAIVGQIDRLIDARRGTPITAASLAALKLPAKLIDGGARLMLPYL
jgi:cardiolipin synthase